MRSPSTVSVATFVALIRIACAAAPTTGSGVAGAAPISTETVQYEISQSPQEWHGPAILLSARPTFSRDSTTPRYPLVVTAIDSSREAPLDSTRYPAGSTVIPVEDLDGIVLLPAILRGATGRDTTGTLVLDTGAGSLALDATLGRSLGVADSGSLTVAAQFAPRELPGLQIGEFEAGPLRPLLVDMSPVWSAIDRRPLGLLGEAPLSGGAVILDRDHGTLTLVPPVDSTSPDTDRVAASRRWLAGAIASNSRAVPIRIGADGKILIHARISPPGASTHPDILPDSIVLVLDTGATKCVLFEDAIAPVAPGIANWPSMRGLSAPTLFGSTPARVALLQALAVIGDSIVVAEEHVDALITAGALSAALQRVVGQPVHGILGDSFLRRFRVAVDYRNAVLWLTPRGRAGSARPYEYCQPGIQIERSQRLARVSGVVESSPAALAGVQPGDEVVAIGHMPAAEVSVLDLAHALEGPPGSRVRVELRRGHRRRTLVLSRRRLLPEA